MFGLGTKKELTDEEAMARFRNGDARGFDLLLQRHSAGLLRFIMRMIKATKPQAEDLLQEVFLKIIENRKKYDSNQRFTSWLYSLARNHCIDYIRVEKYRQHNSLDSSSFSNKSDGPVILDIIRSKDKNQEERAIDEETHTLLNQGIEDLKKELREVFLLREIEGLSLKEIGDITEVPLSTVKSRLRYAYRDLRHYFIKVGYFEEVQRAKEV